MIREKVIRQGEVWQEKGLENIKLKGTYIGKKEKENNLIKEWKIEISVHGGEYTIKKDKNTVVMSIGLREHKRIKTLEGTKIEERSEKSIILSNISKKKLSEECNRILRVKDLKKNRGKGIKIRYIE